jgi:hypothetical protein
LPILSSKAEFTIDRPFSCFGRFRQAIAPKLHPTAPALSHILPVKDSPGLVKQTTIALVHFPLTVGKIWDTSFDFAFRV